VFVGIEVATWNVQRESRQKSAIFTERLEDDLRREGLRRDCQLEYYDEVRAAGEAAAAALDGTRPLSNGALLVHACRATQYWQTPSQRATYDELVSTGSIGLIMDHRLVALAVSTFGNARALDTAADALRKDPQTLRLLRRRLADTDTLLSDISRNNRNLREGLAAIAKDAP
jgi:hypothetical protein